MTNEQQLHHESDEMLELLKTAVLRVQLANEDGDPILSAWAVDATALIRRIEPAF